MQNLSIFSWFVNLNESSPKMLASIFLVLIYMVFRGHFWDLIIIFMSRTDIPHPAVGNADDILIVSSGPRARTVNNRLNEYLEGLGEYFLKWTLNLTKDCSSHVQRNYEVYLTELQNLYSILVEGWRSPLEHLMKYFGVIFHKNFEYYCHIDDVLYKTKIVFNIYHSTQMERLRR